MEGRALKRRTLFPALLLAAIAPPAVAQDEVAAAQRVDGESFAAGANATLGALAEAVPEPAAAEGDHEVVHGEASWYGPGLHGRRTASGERFDRGALTAAHPSLPFGTLVRVEDLKSGRSVEVRINDRGPHGFRNRIIDLSEAAARVLGMGRVRGTAPVRIRILKHPRR